MARAIALYGFLFSIVGFALPDAISDFPSGSYLGEGRMRSTVDGNGDITTYATQANISFDSINFTIVRSGELYTYDLTFDFFDDSGFFVVEAQEMVEDEEITHFGYGYCGSVQCHFDFALTNRHIEETITFSTSENKIYTLGSMRYVDENGDDQAVSWEEGFIRIENRGLPHLPVPTLPPIPVPPPPSVGIPVPVIPQNMGA